VGSSLLGDSIVIEGANIFPLDLAEVVRTAIDDRAPTLLVRSCRLTTSPPHPS
jgi:hypothetical protein